MKFEIPSISTKKNHNISIEYYLKLPHSSRTTLVADIDVDIYELYTEY